MENFNTKEIITVLLKNKKPILIVVILAALVSGVASFLLKPKFKSYAVVYPVNLSPSSEESNTEQLLQFFNSEEVMESVAKKLDLYTHYEIDTADAGARSMFKLYFNGNVKISPTLYESIEIEVKDESPKTARDITQGLIDATNNLIRELKKERLMEYSLNMQKAIGQQGLKVDTIKNEINDVQTKYNIIDIGYQSRYLSKNLIDNKPLSETNKLTMEGIKTKTSVMRILNLQLDAQLITANGFRDQMDKYMADYNSKISYTNIVSKPTLPDKKCFPVRWIIVTVSTFSAFALACLFFIITNKSIRKVD